MIMQLSNSSQIILKSDKYKHYFGIHVRWGTAILCVLQILSLILCLVILILPLTHSKLSSHLVAEGSKEDTSLEQLQTNSKIDSNSDANSAPLFDFAEIVITDDKKNDGTVMDNEKHSIFGKAVIDVNYKNINAGRFEVWYIISKVVESTIIPPVGKVLALAAPSKENTMTVLETQHIETVLLANHVKHNAAGQTLFPGVSLACTNRQLAILLCTLSLLLSNLLLIGVLDKKPNLILPYVLVQIFNYVICCTTVLFYFMCSPDIKSWISAIPYLPLKEQLLHLHCRVLALFCLMVLSLYLCIKACLIEMVWYCYKYLLYKNTEQNCSRCNDDKSDIVTGKSTKAIHVVDAANSITYILPPAYFDDIIIPTKDKKDYNLNIV